MAPRSFWKGYLKLSLVTCAVAMTPATTENEKVRFHTLNRKTGNRVLSQYVDAKTGKPVGDDDEIKGYQRGEDDYVMLEDDEIDAVALESTRTIDIENFVSADSIGWIWFDKPHYLTPNDQVGEEAFSVIRDAMASTGTVGISRLVMYRRERAETAVRNIDFSSWQNLIVTIIGLALFTLISIGIRLLMMFTIQQRRERMNRQINERLRVLIAAYKTLGGSFTGDLTVDPAHLRDLRLRGQSSGESDATADLMEIETGSDRKRRIRDDVEAALLDIILLGTEEHVRLPTTRFRSIIVHSSIVR